MDPNQPDSRPDAKGDVNAEQRHIDAPVGKPNRMISRVKQMILGLLSTDRGSVKSSPNTMAMEEVNDLDREVRVEGDKTDQTGEKIEPEIPVPIVERTLTDAEWEITGRDIDTRLRNAPQNEDIRGAIELIVDIAPSQRIKCLTRIYHCCKDTRGGVEQVDACRKKAGISDTENAEALGTLVMNLIRAADFTTPNLQNELMNLIAANAETANVVSTHIRRNLVAVLKTGKSLDLSAEVLHKIGFTLTDEEIVAAKEEALIHELQKDVDETSEWINDMRILHITNLARALPAVHNPFERRATSPGVPMTESLKTLARQNLRSALQTSSPDKLETFTETFGISAEEIKEEGVVFIRAKMEEMKHAPEPRGRRFQTADGHPPIGILITSVKGIMERAKVTGADIETEAMAVIEHMLDTNQDGFVPILLEELSIDASKLLDDRFKEKIKASIEAKLVAAEKGDKYLDQYFAYWKLLDGCNIYLEVLEAHLIASLLHDTNNSNLRSSAGDHNEGKIRQLFLVLKKLPPALNISAEMGAAAQKWLNNAVSWGVHENTIDIARTLGASTDGPDFQKAAKNGVLHFLGDSYNPRFIPALQNFIAATSFDVAANLEDPSFKAAAVKKLYDGLVSAQYEVAVDLKNMFNLQAEFESKEATQSALIGACTVLANNRAEAALEFVKNMKLRESDVARHFSGAMNAGELTVETVIENIHIIPDGILGKMDKRYCIMQYKETIGIISFKIYQEYARLMTMEGPTAASGFAIEIRNRRDAMISGKKQDPSIIEQPFYKEIILATFPNHAGNFYNYDSTESCTDRSDDLAPYTVREHYSFTVKPGSEMRIREGTVQDADALARIERPIRDAGYADTGNDAERSKALLTQRLAEKVVSVQLEACCKTEEEQLLGLILKNMTGEVSTDEMCDLLVGYHLSRSPDTEQYAGGTRENVEKAKNKEYQHLLELHEFYGDRMKDATRKICELALSNPEVRALLPVYFKKITEQKAANERKELLLRSRIDKLGMSSDFLAACTKAVNGEMKKKKIDITYTDEQVRTMIRHCEDGVALETLSAALKGMVAKQRKDTLLGLQALNGPTAEMPAHLEDVTFANSETGNESSEVFNEDKFAALLVEDTQKVLASPLKDIENELNKYEAVDSDAGPKKKKRVEAYVTKNHTSAHARGVAGVCVSKDTPRQYAEENQWDKPNYLQMVLRDGDTKICQGCVLMYIEEHNGKRVLTASVNPSSTYLFSVNESEMFTEIQKQLIAFAQDNNIDAVGLSRNKNIRTNRTGGEFEKAMARAVKECGHEVVFEENRFFSTFNKYTQKEIDLVWAKNPESFDANTSSEMTQ